MCMVALIVEMSMFGRLRLPEVVDNINHCIKSYTYEYNNNGCGVSFNQYLKLCETHTLYGLCLHSLILLRLFKEFS